MIFLLTFRSYWFGVIIFPVVILYEVKNCLKNFLISSSNDNLEYSYLENLDNL